MYLSKLRENKFELKDEAKVLRYVLPISYDKEKCVVEPIQVIKNFLLFNI